MHAILNRLSFAKKFVLVLLAPTLGLLVFAALGITNKAQQHGLARQTADATALVERASKVIRAIQLERGLSMAVVRSHGQIFKEQLARQRLDTDEAIIHCRELAANISDSRHARMFSNALDQLPELRKKVADSESHTLVFASFTQTVQEGLRFIQSTLRGIHDSGGQLIGADTSIPLHWGQEAAGRQRALLTGMIASGAFSPSEYTELSEYIHLYEQKLGEFEYVASTEQRSQFTKLQSQPSFLAVQHFLDQMENKRMLAEHASHLRLEAGFLGLVHDYKNFLLRGDIEYKNRFVIKFKAALGHVDDLYAFAGNASKEADVRVIEATFRAYRANIDVIARLRAQGLSASEIDDAVSIDDEPSAIALKSLETSFDSHALRIWWEAATKRIDHLAAFNAGTISRLRHQSHLRAERARFLVFAYIGLACGALLAGLYLVIAVLRQAKPLEEVTRRLDAMAGGRYEDLDPMFVPGTDEISELAQAYNAFSDGLRRLTKRGTTVAQGQDVVESDTSPGTQKTIDNVGPLAEALITLEQKQAQLGLIARTIASDDLENPLLDQHFEGVLGESFSEMTKTLRDLARQANAIAQGELSDPALVATTDGNLGAAFQNMIDSLRTLALQVQAIAHSDLDAQVLRQEVPGDLGKHIAMLAGDLSAMKEQLLVSERMSSMGMLAAGIGHEINNPLSYVLANVEWVHGELSEEPGNAALVEALSEAKVGAERVREITRDLNVFTRTQDGELESTNVQMVMESAMRMARSHVRGRAEILCQFQKTEHAHANEGKLGQVFLNLIINAAQSIPATEEGRINLTIAQQDKKIRITIADNGDGIPEDIKKRIFEPFFSTKKKAGTGLGLAICRQIINGFEGTIHVESTTGGGATFVIELNEFAKEAPPTVTRPPSTSHIRLQVLVVDDDKSVARAVRRLISKHEVTIVHSGKEALALCGEQEFDLILCDLMMPGMTGMELFEEWKQAFPDLADRVIFLTGGAFTPAMKAFVETTDRPILYKPVSQEDLLEQIALL